MNIIYLISQIVGFVAFLISLFAYHKNKKEKIFKTMILANLLDITHYLLLGAYSGCITKVIALIRNQIIILKEKHKNLNNTIILIILLVVYLISGILTYKNLWDSDELKVKRIAFYCHFLWLTYNICIFSIVGIISNIVSIISTFIAIHIENRKKIHR